MLEKLFTDTAVKSATEMRLEWLWANQHPFLHTMIEITPSWWIVVIAVVGINIVTRRKGR